MLKFQLQLILLNVFSLSLNVLRAVLSWSLFSEGGSSPGGGAMIPGSEVSGRPYICCVKKKERSTEPSPFGFHWYPVKKSMGLTEPARVFGKLRGMKDVF